MQIGTSHVAASQSQTIGLQSSYGRHVHAACL